MARLPLSTQTPMPTQRQMQAQASTSNSLAGAMDMFFKVATVGNEIAKTGAVIRQVQLAESQLAWQRESLPQTMQHDRDMQATRHSIAEIEAQSRAVAARAQTEAARLGFAEGVYKARAMLNAKEMDVTLGQAQLDEQIRTTDFAREQVALTGQYTTERMQMSFPFGLASQDPRQERSSGTIAQIMGVADTTLKAPGIARQANWLHSVSATYGQTQPFMVDAVQTQSLLARTNVRLVREDGSETQLGLMRVAAILQRGRGSDRPGVRQMLLAAGYSDEDIEAFANVRSLASPSMFPGEFDANARQAARRELLGLIEEARAMGLSADTEAFRAFIQEEYSPIAEKYQLDPTRVPPIAARPELEGNVLRGMGREPGVSPSPVTMSRFVGGLVPPDRDQFGDILGEGAPGVAQPNPAARSGESVVDEGEGSLSPVSRQTEPRDRVVTKYGGGILGQTRPVGEGDLVLPDAIDRYLVYMQSNTMRWLNHGALIEMLKERAPKTRTRGGFVAYRVSPELYDEVRQAVRDAEEAARAAQRRRPSRS